MARTDGKVIAWSSKVFCAAARAAMPAGSRTGDVDIPEDEQLGSSRMWVTWA